VPCPPARVARPLPAKTACARRLTRRDPEAAPPSSACSRRPDSVFKKKCRPRPRAARACERRPRMREREGGGGWPPRAIVIHWGRRGAGATLSKSKLVCGFQICGTTLIMNDVCGNWNMRHTEHTQYQLSAALVRASMPVFVFFYHVLHCRTKKPCEGLVPFKLYLYTLPPR
jgi:hypothetical protein